MIGWIDNELALHWYHDNDLIDTNDIVFIISCPDQDKASVVLNAASLTLQAIQQNLYVENIHQPNGAYVYAYFNDGILNYDNCFYVGMSGGDPKRWVSHIKNVLNNRNNPPRNAKDSSIINWILNQRANNIDEGLTDFDLLTIAKNNLVKIIATWGGPHAEACASAAEHLIIRCRCSVYSLSNLTGGNRKFRDVEFLVKERHLDLNIPHHSATWHHAIDLFLANPNDTYLKDRVRPLIHLLSNSNYFIDLDNWMHQSGLTPTPTRFGKVPDYAVNETPQHHSIDGAADACITYLTLNEALPFRVELKLSMRNSSVYVNIRPRTDTVLGKTNFYGFINTYFSQYYQEGGALIKNYDKAPYFKPFALNGNGKKDHAFSLNEADGPSQLSCNWIDNQAVQLMTLGSAMSRFLEHCRANQI